jgi:hypothetical protein
MWQSARLALAFILFASGTLAANEPVTAERAKDTKVHFMPLSRERMGNLKRPELNSHFAGV